jgi:hypothetical protein
MWQDLIIFICRFIASEHGRELGTNEQWQSEGQDEQNDIRSRDTVIPGKSSNQKQEE